jgi:hypothetical protein
MFLSILQKLSITGLKQKLPVRSLTWINELQGDNMNHLFIKKNKNNLQFLCNFFTSHGPW